MADVVVTPTPQVVVPVEPVTPAPAPVTPDSQVASAAPVQKTLADAQIVAPVVMPPTVPQTPVTGSSEELERAEQRVKDAQRKMHESTAEASHLRVQLQTILNHPMLGPVVKSITAPAGTPQSLVNDPMKEAFKKYQEAPNDEEAFRVLMATAEQRSRDRVVNELHETEIQRTNQARAKQRDTLVAQAINAEVSEKAPDVPLELFWAMSTRAEMETPVTLVTLPEKLEWQIRRSVELARGVMDARTRQAVNATVQGQAVRQTAAPVMPAGSAGATGGPGTTTPGKTFVEQLREAQTRKITS